MAILDNLEGVLQRLRAAALRAGRDPAGVELVAVTKTAGPEAVWELARSGCVRHLGESRVQAAAAKRASIEDRRPAPPDLQWRMIGHLQRNKVRQALDVFDSVDSLDTLPLAAQLDTQLAARGRTLPVLVQVKLSARESQHGVGPEDIGPFLIEARSFKRLDVRGLMAIAPMLDPVEAVRPYFRKMRELFARFFPHEGAILSMGMSRDLEIAVEEGANMVRVGSALFSLAPGRQGRLAEGAAS